MGCVFVLLSKAHIGKNRCEPCQAGSILSCVSITHCTSSVAFRFLLWSYCKPAPCSVVCAENRFDPSCVLEQPLSLSVCFRAPYPCTALNHARQPSTCFPRCRCVDYLGSLDPYFWTCVTLSPSLPPRELDLLRHLLCPLLCVVSNSEQSLLSEIHVPLGIKTVLIEGERGSGKTALLAKARSKP